MEASSRWQVIGKSGSAAVQVSLRRGESVKAEPDALVTMSQHIEVGAKMDAGFLGGLMRTAFTGESLFSQTLTATLNGDVILCAPEVGDVELLQLSPDTPVLLQKGAFLAADQAVDVTTATQNSVGRALFSGAGFFVLRASGRGTLAAAAHGSILRYTLAPGEVRAVDNGHLVAWSASMQYEMRMAGGGGGRGFLSAAVSSATSGEGLMCFFEGPGKLWLQTHKPPPPADPQRGGRGGRAGGGGGGGAAAIVCVLLVLVIFVVIFGVAFLSVVASSAGGLQGVFGGGSSGGGGPVPPRLSGQPRGAGTAARRASGGYNRPRDEYQHQYHSSARYSSEDEL